ncbi:cytochrome c oxidase subunit II [Leucobacter soli]|uniref:Cytochrome aa3 subunit 2 n=1 Tax=Leucobacter soli TaxID=2812850 RepID=A0A916NGD3_9MICO|nr:cytochrome c oxidase subunit II [Leucobacter soli]CAG7602890.1 Cytochrome c oxidase subunit 2 [Leucobacter soli]
MKWALAPAALAAASLLAGCTAEQQRGFLPENSTNATDLTPGITAMWVNAWIVLLVIGAIVWGLVIWATIVYRRRKGQTGLPVQLRYNMPIETFFTVVPVILILGFFAFTAQEQTKIEARFDEPENVVEVWGKRWAWDFNYITDDRYFQSVQVEIEDDGSPTEALPVLYLPVNKTTEIRLETRDVIHSFWVVEFLYKKDMIPGQTNYMSFTPTQVGTYMGKCAELCGEYHSAMLFEVEVLEQADYDAKMAELKQGRVGEEANPLQDQFFGDEAKAENE